MCVAGEPLRTHVDAMIGAIRDSLLKLNARKSFNQLFLALRQMLDEAQRRSSEMREMLSASYTRLNTEFGFTLVPAPPPELLRFRDDLALIERNYTQYLGISQAMRLAQARFLEQFRRMLMSRLRVVFENASSEIELWNRAASAQIDAQLRDRRRAFKRRRDSLERIQAAAGELETRLAELDATDQRIDATEAELVGLCEAVRRAARRKELGPDTQDDAPVGSLDDLAITPLSTFAPVTFDALPPLPDLDLMLDFDTPDDDASADAGDLDLDAAAAPVGTPPSPSAVADKSDAMVIELLTPASAGGDEASSFPMPRVMGARA